MATTFNWTVESIDTVPNQDGDDYVAQLVHWRVTGTDGVNTASTAGSTHIPLSDVEQFTPFNELTAVVVIGWVKDTLNTPLAQNQREMLGEEVTSKTHFTTVDYEAIVEKILDQKSSAALPWTPPEPTPVQEVPAFVTMREAKLALFAAGLLDNVDEAITNLPSPNKELATIEWTSASMIYRDSAFVQALGGSLNLTEEQIDDLFIGASGL